jgi:hypothetical protein
MGSGVAAPGAESKGWQNKCILNEKVSLLGIKEF